MLCSAASEDRRAVAGDRAAEANEMDKAAAPRARTGQAESSDAASAASRREREIGALRRADVGVDDVGEANVFVSHAWSGGFCDLADALESMLADGSARERRRLRL